MFGKFIGLFNKPTVKFGPGERCIVLRNEKGEIVKSSANPCHIGYDVVEKELRDWARDYGYRIDGSFRETPLKV